MQGRYAALDARANVRIHSLVSPEWEVVDGRRLRRTFRWRNFLRAMFFVNGLAYLAEQEGHHPDMTISYDWVAGELTPHAIGGLSRNDFLLAAKIDRLVVQE